METYGSYKRLAAPAQDAQNRSAETLNLCCLWLHLPSALSSCVKRHLAGIRACLERVCESRAALSLSLSFSLSLSLSLSFSFSFSTIRVSVYAGQCERGRVARKKRTAETKRPKLPPGPTFLNHGSIASGFERPNGPFKRSILFQGRSPKICLAVQVLEVYSPRAVHVKPGQNPVLTFL